MEDNKSLGLLIREERNRKKITQAQLGKMIGLKESRISKIEHGAPITPEVASFILSKMGSKLEVKVVGEKKYDPNVIALMMPAIYQFAKEKGLTLDKAYRYLYLFKGLDFLQKHYEIEQMLNSDEITQDLTKVCSNHGGLL